MFAAVSRLPRRWTYPNAGFLLAQGAPCGFLLLRLVLTGGAPTPAWLARELSSQPATYLYMEVSTAIVFVVLGALLGAHQDRIRAASLQDPLTGLANRRHLQASLLAEVERAVRQRSRLALLLVDVDGLKSINDRGGHAAGDAAIKAVGDALGRTCRRIDLAARHGGDEFAVLCPGTGADDAVALAERIRAALAGRAGAPTISIGVSDLARATAPTAEALTASADRSLYEAKTTGRDRVVVAPPLA